MSKWTRSKSITFSRTISLIQIKHLFKDSLASSNPVEERVSPCLSPFSRRVDTDRIHLVIHESGLYHVGSLFRIRGQTRRDMFSGWVWSKKHSSPVEERVSVSLSSSSRKITNRMQAGFFGGWMDGHHTATKMSKSSANWASSAQFVEGFGHPIYRVVLFIQLPKDLVWITYVAFFKDLDKRGEACSSAGFEEAKSTQGQT